MAESSKLGRISWYSFKYGYSSNSPYRGVIRPVEV